MAFEKIAFAMKTWKDKVSGNTPITAAELNRIEKGISDTAKGVNALGDSVSRAPLAFDRYIGTTDVDWDSVTSEVAIVNYGSAIPNGVHAPADAYGYGILFSAIVNGGIGYQIYLPANGEDFYTRFTWGTTWINWTKYSSVRA